MSSNPPDQPLMSADYVAIWREIEAENQLASELGLRHYDGCSVRPCIYVRLDDDRFTSLGEAVAERDALLDSESK